MEESGRFERHGVNRAVVSSDAQHPGWFTLPGAPGGDRTLTPCGTGSWDRRVSRNSTTSACVPRAAAMLPIVDSNHNRRIQGAVSCRLDEWAWGLHYRRAGRPAGEMHAHAMDISKIKPATKDRQDDRI